MSLTLLPYDRPQSGGVVDVWKRLAQYAVHGCGTLGNLQVFLTLAQYAACSL